MSQMPQTDRFPRFWIAWWTVVLLTVGFEAPRWIHSRTRVEALTGWLCGREADWLPFLPIFLSALIIWHIRSGRRGTDASSQLPPRGTSQCSEFRCHRPVLDILISVLLGGLAMVVTAAVGWQMQELPPTYHDEFSYLFQAQTFLEGRTWFPSFQTLPHLFDQMHVLNEGRFASRYFPGTGVWLALFHSTEPIYGIWLAQGIVATGASMAAGEMAGRTARIVTGLSVAFSPGLCLFSQLYLAHMPTLVGLIVFLVAMLRLRRTCDPPREVMRTRWTPLLAYGSAFLGGCGLSYAMLCRPMTAAGVGLPFGVWLIAWAARQWRNKTEFETHAGQSRLSTPRISPSPLATFASIGLPILTGIGVELWYNHAITGHSLRSPYQEYTDRYTPRHVFGFNNVVRGEQHLGPQVLVNYDRWAENLTLPLALKKMGIRLVASGRWTLGLVPLVFVSVLFVANWRRFTIDTKLVAGSIISLHLVHLPYWFEGIMGWHYVFETAPLWCLILGVTTADILQQTRAKGHRALGWWWLAVVLLSWGIQWTTIPQLWESRLSRGLAELQFSRQAYARFDDQLRLRIHGRGIVFVRSNPADRHIDYIYNTPRLDSEILRARAPEVEAELLQAVALFPDREAWLYDAVSNHWTRLRPSQSNDTSQPREHISPSGA